MSVFFLFFLKMKLPSSVGQKKIKAIEQMLVDLGVGEYSLHILFALVCHQLTLTLMFQAVMVQFLPLFSVSVFCRCHVLLCLFFT